jgi:hypothetical protein
MTDFPANTVRRPGRGGNFERRGGRSCRGARDGRSAPSSRLVIGVKVLVAGKEEIAEASKRVSDSGQITLPLIGAINMDGMSPAELESRLTEAYATYFVNPQVIVDVMKDERPDAVSPWGSVTVLGRVKQPGRIAIPPTMDLTVSAAFTGRRIRQQRPEDGDSGHASSSGWPSGCPGDQH